MQREHTAHPPQQIYSFPIIENNQLHYRYFAFASFASNCLKPNSTFDDLFLAAVNHLVPLLSLYTKFYPYNCLKVTEKWISLKQNLKLS